MLRSMKNLDTDNQDYIFDTYDYKSGYQDISLQNKASMLIIKQLIFMTNEPQQKIIWDSINNKCVKDTLFTKIKQVVKKYEILLQEYYDELEFKEKKYRGYMGW